MNEQETLRLKSLELAVQHLSEDAHNLETVLHWAGKFYGWLTQDSERAHPVGYDEDSKSYPIVRLNEDMVSKEKLKAMLPTLGSQFKRNRLPDASEVVGYKQAIDDMLRLIDTM